MKHISKLIAPLALAVSVTAQADVFGGSVEASYWYAGLGGDASFGSGASVDVEDNLGFERS